MDADSDPLRILAIELSVGRGTAEILHQQLPPAISNSRILELKSGHDAAGDPPITSLVGLKICIRHRTNLAAPKGPWAGEFSSHLARAASQRARVSVYQNAPAAIDPEPGGQLIGQLHIHFVEAQIDSIDRRLAIENKFIAQV